MIRLATASPDFEAGFLALLHQARETTESVDRVVSAIVADVRAQGDAALLRYTAAFDRMTLTAERLRVSASEIDAAVASVPVEQMRALEVAAERIGAFSSGADARRSSDDRHRRHDVGDALDRVGLGGAVCARG